MINHLLSLVSGEYPLFPWQLHFLIPPYSKEVSTFACPKFDSFLLSLAFPLLDIRDTPSTSETASFLFSRIDSPVHKYPFPFERRWMERFDKKRDFFSFDMCDVASSSGSSWPLYDFLLRRGLRKLTRSTVKSIPPFSLLPQSTGPSLLMTSFW